MLPRHLHHGQGYLHCGDTIILVCFPAPPALQKSLCERWTQYCSHQPLRVAVGNYNINGGKHFRSVAYKVVILMMEMMTMT